MKTYLITPAFCKAAMLEGCLDHLYQETPNWMEHIIVDDGYPVDKDDNQERIRQLARERNLLYVDTGSNIGFHKALNFGCKVAGVTQDDLLLLCDPDDRPSPGAMLALEQVMKSDPKIVVGALSFDVIHNNLKPGVNCREEMRAGHRVWIHETTDMWNVTAYNMNFIHSIGGFDEPFPYYGGIESYLFSHWRKDMNQKLVYLPDHRSDHIVLNKQDSFLFDRSYRLWKDAAVTGYKGSFSEWLKVFG